MIELLMNRRILPVKKSKISSVSMNEEKQRRRKRLKLIKRLAESSGITQDHKIKPGKLFSVHKQEGHYFQKEL